MRKNIELVAHNNSNLKENPFSIKANPNVVGMEKEKWLLIEYIKNGDICFLTGPTGTGKTSLLLWLKNNYPKNVFYIDAANVGKGFSIKEFLKKSRRGFDIFRAYPKDAVILLDESQDCDDALQKALKLHWDHGHIKSIVITQINQKLNFSDSFKDRIGRRIIKLGKLKKSDAINLINSRLKNKRLFDEKAVEKIIKTADYIPRKILELCELVCIKNKGKKIKLANLKKVLDKKMKNYEKLSSMQKEQIDNKPLSDKKINKIPRFTLPQKKIIRSLDKGKTTEEISKDLKIPLEEIKKELDNLQNLGIITIQEQKIYLIKSL